MQKIIELLKGKQILFLENSSTLDGEAKAFEVILTEGEVEHRVLTNIRGLMTDYLVEAIQAAEVIVFQTTWLYDISHQLESLVRSMEKKMIVVECFTNEPTWFYASQHGSKHDVYIFNGELFYLLSDKPYWEEMP